MRKVLLQRKDHCGVTPLKVDEVVYNNSLEILNYYTSVFTPITTETPPPMSEPLTPGLFRLTLMVLLNY